MIVDYDHCFMLLFMIEYETVVCIISVFNNHKESDNSMCSAEYAESQSTETEDEDFFFELLAEMRLP